MRERKDAKPIRALETSEEEAAIQNIAKASSTLVEGSVMDRRTALKRMATIMASVTVPAWVIGCSEDPIDAYSSGGYSSPISSRTSMTRSRRRR